MNHAFNSQQLSNKALLAGHLAFQHHYYQQQHHHHHQPPAFYIPEAGVDKQPAQQGGVATTSAAFRGVSSDSDTSCQHVIHDDDVVRSSSSSSQQGRHPPAAVVADSGALAINPDVFFPRCCDVSEGGGVSSMLRAFAVSAAVALLRRAANDEVRDHLPESYFDSNPI